MSLENFYNEQYSEQEHLFGAGEPEETVKDILKFKSSGSVLELGAGQGRNSLFLAENGFAVSANDASEVGVRTIGKRAEEKGLSVQAEVQDIRELNLERNFDIFVSTYVLHHLKSEEALTLIKHIQEHTNPDGLNVLATFMGKGDFATRDSSDPSSQNFYPQEGELRELYRDWEILEYEEKEVTTRAQNPDGSQKMNFSAKIIAKKPK